MITIRAEDVRIPRLARDAVARHEHVQVMSHDRPAFVIVHPDDDPATAHAAPRGRPLREALTLLAAGPAPDPDFARDMEDVHASVGRVPEDPWAQS
jgi:hypothetical protein